MRSRTDVLKTRIDQYRIYAETINRHDLVKACEAAEQYRVNGYTRTARRIVQHIVDQLVLREMGYVA